MRIRACIILVASVLSSVSVADPCYYPDGKSAGALIPCNSTALVTNCCRKSDICLTNGLCFSSGLGSVVRRGCTDKTWNSTECPNFCITGESRSAEAVLTPCGQYNFFCCGQDNAARACCTSGNGTIAVGGGDPYDEKTFVYNTTTITSTATATPSATAALSPNNSTLEADCVADCKTERNVAIALGALLGVTLLGLVILGMDWLHKKNELGRPGAGQPAIIKPMA